MVDGNLLAIMLPTPENYAGNFPTNLAEVKLSLYTWKEEQQLIVTASGNDDTLIQWRVNNPSNELVEAEKSWLSRLVVVSYAALKGRYAGRQGWYDDHNGIPYPFTSMTDLDDANYLLYKRPT